MLPGGRQYVELHTDEYGIYDHYEKRRVQRHLSKTHR
jgi:hypothetical protein